LRQAKDNCFFVLLRAQKGIPVTQSQIPSVLHPHASRLGEGPLWHPLRAQFFWFDILEMRLHSIKDDELLTWQFDEYVSAAGWVDEETLVIASQTGMMLFHIPSGETEFLCALEADNDLTRSNDGRADPLGGFWISTMGLNAEPKAGAIYRYFDGQLRKVVGNLTIPNSICFAPDGHCAYYADTATDKIMKIELDEDGWPQGKASLFVAAAHTPDGSITDANGNLWNAQWGRGMLACYSPEGALLKEVSTGTSQNTCPALGGLNGDTMYVTSAFEGLSEGVRAQNVQEGCVIQIEGLAQGLPEPSVLL
jgi:sugar lactone lactonase YvrE